MNEYGWLQNARVTVIDQLRIQNGVVIGSEFGLTSLAAVRKEKFV